MAKEVRPAIWGMGILIVLYLLYLFAVSWITFWQRIWS